MMEQEEIKDFLTIVSEAYDISMEEVYKAIAMYEDSRGL